MDIRTISNLTVARTPPPSPGIAGGGTAGSVRDAGAAPTSTTPPQYLSPVYKYDPIAKISIFQYRDVNTGAVKSEFPPQKVIDQYRRNALENLTASGQKLPTAAPTTAASTTTTPPTAPVTRTGTVAPSPVSNTTALAGQAPVAPAPAPTTATPTASTGRPSASVAAPASASPAPAPPPAAIVSAPAVARVSLSV